MSINAHPLRTKSTVSVWPAVLEMPSSLESYQRDLADEVAPSQQAIFDSGTASWTSSRGSDSRAAGLFGPHITSSVRRKEPRTGYWRNTSIPALYEPAFSFEGIRTRVDILRRTDGGNFDLIEVKSTIETEGMFISQTLTDQGVRGGRDAVSQSGART